jgi:hypothetical protein
MAILTERDRRKEGYDDHAQQNGKISSHIVAAIYPLH